MAQTSGFFNSQVDGEGIYDRVYLAGDFANYFSSLIGNGIFGGRLNELQVIADSGMNIIIKSGRAFINGYWYQNSDDYQMTIPVNTSASSEYYGIALRLNLSTRAITIVRLNNSDTPVRNSSVYDLILARINVAPGASAIRQSDIIDYRFNDSFCGLVKGLIEQINTTEFATQLDGYIQEVRERTQALEEAINSDIQNITNDTPAMLKSVYDTDNDGIVDEANHASTANTAEKITLKYNLDILNGSFSGVAKIKDDKLIVSGEVSIPLSIINQFKNNQSMIHIPLFSMKASDYDVSKIENFNAAVIPCILYSIGTYYDRAYCPINIKIIPSHNETRFDFVVLPKSGNNGEIGGTPSWDYTYISPIATPHSIAILYLNFEKELA